MDGTLRAALCSGRCCHHFCLTGEKMGLKAKAFVQHPTACEGSRGMGEEAGQKTGNEKPEDATVRNSNLIRQAKVLTIPGQGSGAFGEGNDRNCIMMHCRQELWFTDLVPQLQELPFTDLQGKQDPVRLVPAGLLAPI